MTIAKGRGGDLFLLRGRRVLRAPLNVLDRAGDQMSFYARAVAWTPKTIVHYRKEVLRLLAEVTFGSGALAVIGGTIGVIAMMSGFTGVVVGLQGYAALEQLGSSVLTGFLSAYVNTREIAPPSWRRSRCPRPSDVASPHSSAPCASVRRSTRSK